MKNSQEAREIDGNVEVLKRGCCKGDGQDWHEVLCAERAMVPASMDGRSQTSVVNALTATRKTEGRSKSLRRGKDHALACRSLHVANTTQEVEEVQRRRGLRVAGSANHRLRRQMHQIGDTLQVDGKRATLQDATRERPRRSEVPVTDETRRDRKISTSERTGSSERLGDGLRVHEVDRLRREGRWRRTS